MATLIGLRLLQKNVALRAAVKRHRRIPRGIEYYSRFANQLNFLRILENSSKINKQNSKQDLQSNLFRLNQSQRGLSEVNKLTTASNLEDNSHEDNNNLEKKFNNQIYLSKKSSTFVDYFSNQIEYNENNYIYEHVHKRLDNFASMGDAVDTLPVHSQILALKKLLSNSHIDPVEHKKMIDESMASINSFIKYMNQQELAVLLTSIKNETKPEFRQIMRMIDIELRWLLKTHVRTRLMDLDLWFYCADIFYECLFRSTFVYVLVNFMVRETPEIEMNNAQFLHLLFLVILQRNQHGVLTTYEDRIGQVLKTASFNDIATICMAYFKTRTPITNPQMLADIIDKTAEYLPSIVPTEPGYCSIIKSIRYSTLTGCRENVSHLIMSLTNDIDYKIIMASHYNLVHTVKLMESYRIYDKRLLDLLFEKVFTEEDFRIKDIQYALTSLSNFGYNDLKSNSKMSDRFQKLSQDIINHTRQDSTAQYFHLMPLLRAFTILGYYDKNLLEFAYESMLNEDKLALMKQAIEFDKTALLVYVASIVEGRHTSKEMEDVFKDNRQFISCLRNISTNSIDRIGNCGSIRRDSSLSYLKFLLHQSHYPDHYKNSKLYRTIALGLESNEHLRDSSINLSFQFTLPHQNYADLIISKNCQAPGTFNKDTLIPMKVPEGEKHCAVLATTKYDYIDGYQRLSGYKMLTGRLLEKLGYTVITMDLNRPNIEELALRIKSGLN